VKILLFGGSGQLGWELERSLAPLGEIVAPCRTDAELCGDFLDLEGLRATVQRVRPAIIVNAAAYTAVDRAEEERDAASVVNAAAPGALAVAARLQGAWLLHFSTDYVFDGSGAAPWTETDLPRPLNHYGRSKLEGERLVAAHCERHLILRTSWLYSARGSNFARAILRQAGRNDSLQVVDDQIGAPTGAELLADISAHVLRAAVANPALAGLYHAAAMGETTRHGYARFLVESAIAAGAGLKASPERVHPISTVGVLSAARRPLNSRLETARLREVFGLHLPHWKKGVARMVLQTVVPEVQR
jgi:dTDP-4-dehydrorhamnose reductase